MSTLPPSTNVTDPSTNQGQGKTFFAAIRTWLSEAFGTDSTPSAVRSALGALSKAGDTMTGLLVFKKATDIASSATVNLSTATGNTVSITGTTGITGWTMTAGQVMDVIFAGILTLTHHATNNNLPGAANITTAAGDRARLYFDGTTVYVLMYQRAGVALFAGVTSNAEAAAGTDTVKALTAAALFSTLSKSHAATSGYQKFPNGLILQWVNNVTCNTGTTTTVTWPIAFPTACVAGGAAPNASVGGSLSFVPGGSTTTVGVGNSTGSNLTPSIFGLGY